MNLDELDSDRPLSRRERWSRMMEEQGRRVQRWVTIGVLLILPVAFWLIFIAREKGFESGSMFKRERAAAEWKAKGESGQKAAAAAKASGSGEVGKSAGGSLLGGIIGGDEGAPLDPPKRPAPERYVSTQEMERATRMQKAAPPAPPPQAEKQQQEAPKPPAEPRVGAERPAQSVALKALDDQGNAVQVTVETNGPVAVGNFRLGGSVLGHRRLQGDLVNWAEQTLESARVELDFLDRNGHILARRQLDPLVIAGGVFGDQVKPLEAGMSRVFGLDARDLPSAWKGAVRARVLTYTLAGREAATP
ncbi:hypothetical protein [Magnetofaba australis]|uniref:Uncharacterized protein n=1 Tax=Magnetofaba australis IT-1 TaxID=1434232 RepID=A0A1Y2K1W5_9PROT|nr:hypothetical protein [Magnetofaba australis]OSM01952.1 hypothetical protein MAIT1_02019 [Magnetofaba australis IT-1]